MISRAIPIYSKPVTQLVCRRTLASAKSEAVTAAKQPVFPKGTIWPNIKDRIPAFFGGLSIVVGLFIAFPASVITTSDALGNVPPRGITAAVQIHDGVAKATIPQTYVHLSKE